MHLQVADEHGGIALQLLQAAGAVAGQCTALLQRHELLQGGWAERQVSRQGGLFLTLEQYDRQQNVINTQWLPPETRCCLAEASG